MKSYWLKSNQKPLMVSENECSRPFSISFKICPGVVCSISLQNGVLGLQSTFPPVKRFWLAAANIL